MNKLVKLVIAVILLQQSAAEIIQAQPGLIIEPKLKMFSE